MGKQLKFDRKVKEILVTGEMLLHLLTDKFGSDQIPDDALIIGAEIKHASNIIKLHVHSDTFDPVLEAAEAEQLILRTE